MKKINLLLLSTLFLTGCNYEPLFFTGKEATNEEVLNFFSNVNEGYGFIPDGWYEYTHINKDLLKNNRVSSTKKIIFEIASFRDENNEWSYEFKQIKGVVTMNKNIIKYYGKDKTLIIETTNSKNQTKIEGRNNVKYKINDWYFTYATKVPYTYYLKESSVHMEKIIDEGEDHLGIEYSHDFKTIIQSKMTREMIGKEYDILVESSIKSCDPIEISIDFEYETTQYLDALSKNNELHYPI